MEKKLVLGHPGYNHPRFVWAKGLKEDMRTVTEGKPFE